MILLILIVYLKYVHHYYQLDISIWNTSNLVSMSLLFNGCTSLEKIPDISLWDINNVKIINSIFNNCTKLKYLPDISK